MHNSHHTHRSRPIFSRWLLVAVPVLVVSAAVFGIVFSDIKDAGKGAIGTAMKKAAPVAQQKKQAEPVRPVGSDFKTKIPLRPLQPDKGPKIPPPYSDGANSGSGGEPQPAEETPTPVQSGHPTSYIFQHFWE